MFPPGRCCCCQPTGVGLCQWSCLRRGLQGLVLSSPTGPTCPEGRAPGGAWLREPRCGWRDPSWREELPPWPCALRLGWHDLAPSSIWNLCAEELSTHGSGFLAQLSLPGQQLHPPSRGEVAGPQAPPTAQAGAPSPETRL